VPDTTLQPAGLLRRCGAMLYDGMVVLALWLLTLFILVALRNAAAVGPMVQSLLFIELFAFFSYFWVSRGQTVGMLAWGLILTTDSGARLRPIQALLRFVGALASFASLGLGYLWMYVDPDGRTWSDMLSHSRVVHLRRG
jgi:uncharacterized RDD family membrane protein YckC